MSTYVRMTNIRGRVAITRKTFANRGRSERTGGFFLRLGHRGRLFVLLDQAIHRSGVCSARQRFCMSCPCPSVVLLPFLFPFFFFFSFFFPSLVPRASRGPPRDSLDARPPRTTDRYPRLSRDLSRNPERPSQVPIQGFPLPYSIYLSIGHSNFQFN